MGEENKGANKLQEEKVLQAKSGFGMLVLGILLTAAGIAAFVWGCIVCDGKGADPHLKISLESDKSFCLYFRYIHKINESPNLK